MRVDARDGKIRNLEKEKKPLEEKVTKLEELVQESEKIKSKQQEDKKIMETNINNLKNLLQ